MSIFKPFLTSDTIVSPFKVNKSFTFQGNELTSSNVEIDRYIGVNITSSFLYLVLILQVLLIYKIKP